MLFDTHAHYDDAAFDPDREELIDSLRPAGVAFVVNPGCDVESSRAALRLAERYGFLYAAVGLHPENCAGATEEDFGEIRRLAAHPKAVAIGEIGLDYYWEGNPPRAFQQAVFRRQMELARELNLPVIVHDREAHGDSLAIVREFPGVRGVFHCYSGSPELARELLKLGWYLGFDGPVTYRNARRAPEVAAIAPLDRILIETDSPYMAPVPNRGKRNDSRNVRYVAEKLAEWKGVSPAEMEEITLQNAKKFFGIEGETMEKGFTITYEYGGNLYVNTTNRCDFNCNFCLRHNQTSGGSIYTHNLWLKREPTREEILADIEKWDLTRYGQLVFCGFGEPSYRMDDICWVIDRLHDHGRRPFIRMDTNGTGSLINGRDICPEFKGRFDKVSVSLNTDTAEKFDALCHPEFPNAYQAMKDFTREVRNYVPEVMMSVVNTISKEEIENCRKICEDQIGAAYRVREYIKD